MHVANSAVGTHERDISDHVVRRVPRQKRKRNPALMAGDGVPQEHDSPRPVEEEGEAVAAAEELKAHLEAPGPGEPCGGDAVGRV